MEKRKYIRFNPDENSLIELLFKDEDGNVKKAVGLISDESYHGCGAVFRKKFPFKRGDMINATVGKIINIEAEIIWIQKMDDIFIKVGIYLS